MTWSQVVESWSQRNHSAPLWYWKANSHSPKIVLHGHIGMPFLEEFYKMSRVELEGYSLCNAHIRTYMGICLWLSKSRPALGAAALTQIIPWLHFEYVPQIKQKASGGLKNLDCILPSQSLKQHYLWIQNICVFYLTASTSDKCHFCKKQSN